MKAPLKLYLTDEETLAEQSRGKSVKSVSGKAQNSVILCFEGHAYFFFFAITLILCKLSDYNKPMFTCCRFNVKCQSVP